ncbi:MAG: hypothetical protein ACTSPY_17495 [Candidatus Helarchaeota archaeon]
MPVYIEQFEDTKKLFPEMIPVSKRGDFVYAIAIKMKGIVGGGDGRKIIYHLFIDLTNYPSHIPDVFITNIPDKLIRHINIYHSKGCTKLNGYFPYICLGNLKDALTRYRHLSAFLQGVKRILNNENYNSPARETVNSAAELLERLRDMLF